jgi:hypothetical protein
LPLPVPGVEISDGAKDRIRVDFLYRDHTLAIETDGYQWHRERAVFIKDCRKQTRLAALGIRTIRICSEDLDARPEAVEAAIRAALWGGRSATYRSGANVRWPTASASAQVQREAPLSHLPAADADLDPAPDDDALAPPPRRVLSIRGKSRVRAASRDPPVQ